MIPDITILGGGMIVHDQVLPSVYQLQRQGRVGAIRVAASRTTRLRDLTGPRFTAAFPGQSFEAYPPLTEPDDRLFPEGWKAVVAAMKPRQIVLVATPDELHDEMVTFALRRDQHVICVKPLVHRYEQAKAIRDLALGSGLFVGVEYHKRFDRRSLEARGSYRAGRFGQFRCGEAKLIEPFSYQHSNFQNWFTAQKTDPFAYIGCHYVDLVYFITGLRPVEVSVRGVLGRFPNGNEAYMWSAGRVIFENGGILSVVNGMGYPDQGAGSNDQGMCLYSEAEANGGAGGLIHHSDQFRGVSHSYISPSAAGKHFHFINPDYFRLVPFDGEGLRPVGYGHDSIEALVVAAMEVEAAGAGLGDASALLRRQRALAAIDERGILATPGNSYINELVVEAGRLSIVNGGARVMIDHRPGPAVRML
jgi:predicted dehydrogenase